MSTPDPAPRSARGSAAPGTSVPGRAHQADDPHDTADRRRHHRATTVWTLVVPLGVLAATLAVVRVWSADLPDPVASHFGPDGADGWTALSTLAWAITGSVLGFSLGMWAVGRFLGRQAVTRRFANALAVWFAVFLCGVLLGTLVGQRGLVDAARAEVSDAVLAIGLLASTLAAVAAAVTTPGDRPMPTSAPVPDGVPRLDLSPGEQATWVRRVAPRRFELVLGALVAFSVAIGAVSGQWVFAAVLGVLLLGVLATALHWTVTVDGTGLTARTLVRVPRFHVPLDEVEAADVVDIDPMGDFGGWGLRTGLDGRTGIVMRRGEAIRVRRTGGREVVVTVDDAGTAAGLLNTLAGRSRST